MNKHKNEVAVSVAGIILAAGSASRMGQPKLLLPWKGEALIRHAARTALGCLEPVVVVTGAWATEIQGALTSLAVQVVYNPEWKDGQSTSVRVGINTLSEQIAAAIFLLSDQPYVSTELVQNLVKTYTETRPTILARESAPILYCLTAPFLTLCAICMEMPVGAVSLPSISPHIIYGLMNGYPLMWILLKSTSSCWVMCSIAKFFRIISQITHKHLTDIPRFIWYGWEYKLLAVTRSSTSEDIATPSSNVWIGYPSFTIRSTIVRTSYRMR